VQRTARNDGETMKIKCGLTAVLKSEYTTTILFALYFVCASMLILFKGIFQLSYIGLTGFSGRSVNLLPFLDLVHAVHSSAFLLRSLLIQYAINFCTFIPLGCYCACLIKDRVHYHGGQRHYTGMTVLFSLLLSIAYEVMKYAMECGASNIDNVIMGMAGGAVGAWLFVFIKSKSGDDSRRVVNILGLSVTAAAIVFGAIFL